MFKSNADISHVLGEFKLENRLFRYSSFVPRLYNYCKSLGFEPGKIMPSRAFCSDESQGYPIILISKHFGTFPFNHGVVGGVVATDRHGPHAEHGKDMVIINASHVGYDPELKEFGVYRRMCTEHNEMSDSCGKVGNVVEWYTEEYKFAINNIHIHHKNDEMLLVIDNQLLDMDRKEGLFIHVDKLIKSDNDEIKPVHSYSTSKSFRLHDGLVDYFKGSKDGQVIGDGLKPEYFYFKREIKGDVEGQSHIENNLLRVMPWIVSNESPLLVAAMINTQVEFDRTFRTIAKEKGYRGKRVVYIAGLNIDISPQEGQTFPLTKFVPWAAFVQSADGHQFTLEQDELYQILAQQSDENPDKINMDEAIRIMESVKEVKIF